ncbi:MAG TPA: hydroxymethylglutaryl-CoA lyase [Sphingobacteriaceae bacterium]
MKLIECPRDAMQGIHDFIPTELKAEYLNLLLRVGFDTLDFGSFVSPAAIPQMRDTAAVLEMLDLSATRTKLLAIAANLRGAQDAISHPEITYIGFPFSVSETFQMRNTRSGREDALDTVGRIVELCDAHGRQAVVYLSMGFGNPYGDPWSDDIVAEWASRLAGRGCRILALADTVGVSTPENIKLLFPALVGALPDIEFGLHLHSSPAQAREKIAAAYESGCRRFDSALRGFGGCPMAKDDLVGNIATEALIGYLEERGESPDLDMEKWAEAMSFSSRIF